MSVFPRRVTSHEVGDRKNSLFDSTKIVQLGFAQVPTPPRSIPPFRPQLHLLKKILEEKGLGLKVEITDQYYPLVIFKNDSPVAGVRQHGGEMIFQTIFDVSLRSLGVNKQELVTYLQASIKEVNSHDW